MFPIDVLRFSEFRTMRNHLSETLMLNDIQIISDYMSRWVALKRRVGAVTSQRVLKVLFYVNILQSPKYRLSSIICDVASFRLFKPVRSESLHDNNRKFLHIPFVNKGIDAINISNIINRKEVLMLNDIQIISDYMSRWVALKRRVGAVTSQRVLKVLFYVNILQCFFVVENFTANAKIPPYSVC
jgi:hypothetical protein